MNITKNFVFTIFIIASSLLFAENLKPYVLASQNNDSLEQTAVLVKSKLLENNFEILGQYSPAADQDRLVIIVTNSELIEAVKEAGGLRGFALALRVALTKTNNTVNISYTNPRYWGKAYWGDDYTAVAEIYAQLNSKFMQALSDVGESRMIVFGSDEGLSEKDLAKYRYMFGMERFSDVVELNEFSSYEDAVNTIDGKLSVSDDLVYSVELKDAKIKLYGIAISGEKGEDHFLPIIDITIPKHTAFLPYELLVINNKALMLHGRYRISLSFPDLTMSTFSKIMSTPGDIKKALKYYTE